MTKLYTRILTSLIWKFIEQTKQYYFLITLEGNFLGTSREFGGTFMERKDNTLNWKAEACGNNQHTEDGWVQACHREQAPWTQRPPQAVYPARTLSLSENKVNTPSLWNSSASQMMSNKHFALKRSFPRNCWVLRGNDQWEKLWNVDWW